MVSRIGTPGRSKLAMGLTVCSFQFISGCSACWPRMGTGISGAFIVQSKGSMATTWRGLMRWPLGVRSQRP